MTVKECELRNRLAMLGAINWAKGEDDSEITYWSVVLMCECLDIKCPDYMVKFVSSENVNRFRCYGSYKRIGNFLDKLAKKILEKETYLKENCFVVKEGDKE